MFKGQDIGWFAFTVCHTLFKPTVIVTAFVWFNSLEFLVAFAKYCEQQLLAAPCPSCLLFVSVEQLCCHWNDFCDILCWGLLWKSVDQMEVLLKSDKQCFSWRTMYVCINILPFKVSTKNMISCHLRSKYKNQNRAREAKETVVDLNIIRCHIGVICMLGSCAKNLSTSQCYIIHTHFLS